MSAIRTSISLSTTGWLPLHAVASSFVLHGIQPDEADGSRSTKHDVAEQKRRTRAAHMPAVLFAAIFSVVFIGGKCSLPT